MIAGLIAVRSLHLRAIEETGLSAADEMLYPENWDYINDLLSYVAIGARSVEDQQHRLTVSGFDVASGMKNPTSGDFSVMLNSCICCPASSPFRTSRMGGETLPAIHWLMLSCVVQSTNAGLLSPTITTKGLL